VTSHRILFLNCGFFTFRFRDFHWEHVEDVHISTSFSGSTITATASASKSGYATKVANTRSVKAISSGLINDGAHQVYAVGQKMEQEWREKVRQRIMEEKKIERGQVVLQAPAPAAPLAQSPEAQSRDPADRLRQMKALLDDGVLTQAEFDQKKGEILAAI
jgi:membrane protease subunit (stomatin/prohibitin family)